MFHFPHYHTIWFQLFQFVLLTLAAYRAQRIVTTDTWPPSNWFRDKLKSRFSDDSSIFEFFTCPWCFGSWTTFAVFTVAAFTLNVPLPVLQAVASSALVGKLGSTD